MRFSAHFTRAGIAAAAILALVVACSDSPAEPAAAAPAAAFSQVDGKGPPSFSKQSLHFARVKSDGELVGGTALSSTRFAEGVYILKFPPPISACAATASSASFLGFDASVFRVFTQIGIGFGDGGFDDESVTVSTFDSSTGEREDTSFALTMICP